MLTFLAYAMVLTFMALIMARRLSALVALVLVPVLFGTLAGFGPELPGMVMAGLRAIAPTGVLLLFAILYFGLMIDTGLFDPVVRATQRFAQGDPARVVLGSAALSAIISLDGDGSTTYLLCITAMLPIHRRMGIHPLILPAVTLLPNSIMNIAPWGGPTARVMSVLHLEADQVFLPLILPMAAATVAALAIAWYLGLRERARLGRFAMPPAAEAPAAGRPGLRLFNLGLTLALLGMLASGLVPLAPLFMLAFAIAITVNFPDVGAQRDRIAAHAPSALAVVGLIFAAGAFTGILSGTKMTDAIAQSVVAGIPAGAGNLLPLVTALISAPFTFFLSNDAFYFGVVPILVEAGRAYGIAPEVIARASLIGQPFHQLSPLVAAAWVLVGLAEVEFAELQRFTLKWAGVLMLVLLLTAAATGVVPLW